MANALQRQEVVPAEHRVKFTTRRAGIGLATPTAMQPLGFDDAFSRVCFLQFVLFSGRTSTIVHGNVKVECNFASNYSGG